MRIDKAIVPYASSDVQSYPGFSVLRAISLENYQIVDSDLIFSNKFE